MNKTNLAIPLSMAVYDNNDSKRSMGSVASSIDYYIDPSSAVGKLQLVGQAASFCKTGKKSCMGTRPLPFIYDLSIAAFAILRQN